MAEQDPWDSDPVLADPWDADPTVDELDPAVTRSEKRAREMRWFDWNPAAVALDVAGQVGGAMVAPVVAGYAGIAGMASGALAPNDTARDRGARWARDTQEWLAPTGAKTLGGEVAMAHIGKKFGQIEDVLQAAGSGIAGLSVLPAGGPEEATRAMQEYRGQPGTGERLYEASGSPLLATIGEILPEVASMGAPGRRAAPRARMRPERDIAGLPEGYGGVSPPRAAPGPVEPPLPGAEGRTFTDLPKSPYDELQEALQAGDQRRVLEIVNANPAIVQAFEELGIQNFTPGMVSETPAVRQVEGGLESAAGSGIREAHISVREQLVRKADEMIREVGQRDATMLADDIEDRLRTTNNELEKAADQAWDDLNARVPRAEPIDMRSMASWSEREISLLDPENFDDALAAARKYEPHKYDAFMLTHRRTKVPDPTGASDDLVEVWEYRDPSYERVDSYRRQLGNAYNGRGPFADAETGQIDLLYGMVKKQQGTFATDRGYKAEYDAANRITEQQKAVQKTMVELLGRTLQKSVIPRIRTTASSLLNGDAKPMRELMNRVDEELRPAVAAAILDQIVFTAGRGTRSTASFVDNFNALTTKNRAALDELFSFLPADTRRKFMNIGEASRGYFRALEDKNMSRTANAMSVLKAVESGTWFSRLWYGKILGGAGPKLPFIGEYFQRLYDKRKVGEDRIRAAADLMQSPALNRAIVEHAAGRPEAAQAILDAAEPYKAFLRSVKPTERKDIIRLGLIGYLTQPDQEEE